jgi:dTDP-4-amino-4,6-dideoxygalactose transaminase
MDVPFVDLHRQYQALQAEIDEAQAAVVEEAAFVAGPYAAAFEDAFAAFVGVEHAVGCASGTDALELALEAMGVGPGDEVIVPALTWISTSEAVSNVGAQPVFADIEPDTFTLDPEDAARKLTEATQAILPVHLYGHMAAMPALCDLARDRNLWILEDSAQAHGASWEARAAGTWGDAAIFSFYPSKNLGAWGDAGAVVTDRDDLARHIRLLTNHGQKKKHHHQIEGRNSRMDGLQGTVLSAKLPHLPDWNARREAHAAQYNTLLSDVPAVETPTARPEAEHVYHLYVVEALERDRLQTYLKEREVSTAIHYPTALPFQPCYTHLGHTPDDFPVAHRATQRILSLPMFPELKENELRHVTSALQQFYRHT